jgi:hypothetical protein
MPHPVLDVPCIGDAKDVAGGGGFTLGEAFLAAQQWCMLL